MIRSATILGGGRRGRVFGWLRRALCWGLMIGGCGTVGARAADGLLVFAAASLADALTEVATGFETESGEAVRFQFAGSGLLVRQIEAGAPADVIFTADAVRLDRLATAGWIVAASRRTVLANTLVMVTPGKPEQSLLDPADLRRPTVRRIAIGDPALVPAGTYAETWLRHLELWDVLRPKFIPLGNVRAVLAAVATGNADAGFVYRTDALTEDRVTIVAQMPDTTGGRIEYPAAIVKGAPHAAAAAAFLDYLSSRSAQTVWANYGFRRPVANGAP